MTDCIITGQAISLAELHRWIVAELAQASLAWAQGAAGASSERPMAAVHERRAAVLQALADAAVAAHGTTECRDADLASLRAVCEGCTADLLTMPRLFILALIRRLAIAEGRP